VLPGRDAPAGLPGQRCERGPSRGRHAPGRRDALREQSEDSGPLG
jgi:hypothetical protein